MKIILLSIMVDDQTKAEAFYAGVLGFRKTKDFPAGEHRWLAFVSPEGPDDVEITLEPMGFAPARAWQKALYDAGIPAAMLGAKNVTAEHARLSALGVTFKGPPQKHGPSPMMATFDDTCGNWLMMVETG